MESDSTVDTGTPSRVGGTAVVQPVRSLPAGGEGAGRVLLELGAAIMVMPVNDLPDHLKRRIPPAGVVLSVVMLAIAVWAIVQLFANTHDSYEWLIGANRDVTVAGPCHGGVCQGAWEDSATGRVDGKIHVRAELSDLPPRPFFYRGAKVDGENAYLHGSGHRNFDGLLAPLVLLVAALELLRQVALQRRRERRRQEAIRVWRARYEPTS